ncbi:MAG: A24 family peptidase C-terminal domain-containing protein [Thermoplasmata archaeon]
MGRSADGRRKGPLRVVVSRAASPLRRRGHVASTEGVTTLASVPEGVLIVQLTLLLGGFGYAAVADLRTREVTDRLWQVLGILGVGLGAITVGAGGTVPLVTWLVVGGLTLQHLFPWDDALGPRYDRFADAIEGVSYLGVIAFIAVVALRIGIGPAVLPLSVLALLLTVLFARGLFELGVLYGGADAKALMIAGVLVPIFATPVLAQTPSVAALLVVFPYPIDLLVNAALISVVIPIAIGVRNAARGEFRFPRGFSGYTIPVRELPDRFVWLKDPMSAEGRTEPPAETSEDDRRERVRAAEELRGKGVGRVWVTPQIPFLVLMAAGAATALLAGNLVLDILVRL